MHASEHSALGQVGHAVPHVTPSAAQRCGTISDTTLRARLLVPASHHPYALHCKTPSAQQFSVCGEAGHAVPPFSGYCDTLMYRVRVPVAWSQLLHANQVELQGTAQFST